MPHKLPLVLSRLQRKGILFFLFLVFCAVFAIGWWHYSTPPLLIFDHESMAKWEAQYQKMLLRQESKVKPYQYNVNYLTDYRMYLMGLPNEVYERLLSHRNSGKKINSPKQFQQLTGIADSTLARIRPLLKFPAKSRVKKTVKIPTIKRAINKATAKDLEAVYGIGPVLAARILKYKTYLGGFSTMDQLEEVYGLSQAEVTAVKAQFKVAQIPVIERLAFATATEFELKQLPYITSSQAKELVKLRSKYPNKPIDSLRQYLLWDAVRIQRLALYLY